MVKMVKIIVKDNHFTHIFPSLGTFDKKNIICRLQATSRLRDGYWRQCNRSIFPNKGKSWLKWLK